MANILIYRNIDIINKTNYLKLTQTIETKFNGQCPNFGNKLWYQGIISEISVEENSIDYYCPDMSVDYINENFDLLLYPMANIFSLEYSTGLDIITDFIKKLKIPVFIISCGVQAKSYDELDSLVKSIGEISKRFIKAVYDSGGEIAVRGSFTAEFFKKLGFSHPAVVGCPSLFQLGEDLFISNDKVSPDEFKADLNGSLEIAKPLMKKYNSIYYDQEALFDFLYNDNYYKEKSIGLYNNLKWIKSSGIGFEIVDWLNNNRIRLLADMWDWQHSIQSEKIAFSYGTRIHGNIMAILSGVPAVIVNVDARVKEMAEFYEIPNIEYAEALKLKENGNDLFSLYLHTDYSNFNKKYPKKYRDFQNFLIKCGIINEKLNSNNRFLNCSNGKYPTNSFETSRSRVETIMKHQWLYRLLLSLI